MPIYEYRCAGCGHEFSALRRITDDTLPECPQCKTGLVAKMISLSAFHLKGSGWYKTDYAKDGSSGNSKPAKKATESGESKSNGDAKSNGASTGGDTPTRSAEPASTPATSTSATKPAS